MKRLLTIICATAAVAAPAFASSSADQRAAHKQAVKTCRQQHRALSKADFKALYGKHGVAHCVKKETTENAREAKQAEQQAQANAAQQCKAEQGDENFAASHDGKSFSEFYGTNPNHKNKNAFGKCVSKTTRQLNQEQEQQQES